MARVSHMDFGLVGEGTAYSVVRINVRMSNGLTSQQDSINHVELHISLLTDTDKLPLRRLAVSCVNHDHALPSC